MSQPLVVVEGAKALRRDINRLEKDDRSALYSAMKKAGYRAISPLIPAIRSALPSSSRPPGNGNDPGALRGSVRPSSYKSGAAVRVGSTKIPFAGWVEFGGNRRKPHASSREFIKGGRYIFPASLPLSSLAARTYSEELNKVFASSGVWTNTTDDGGSVHD